MRTMRRMPNDIRPEALTARNFPQVRTRIRNNTTSSSFSNKHVTKASQTNVRILAFDAGPGEGCGLPARIPPWKLRLCPQEI